MDNLNWPALIFALIGMAVLLISLFGNKGSKKTAKPVVVHTVPSIEQITMLKTHYGFDDEGARVMWSWIRSGKADEDSLAVDLFSQKVFREQFMSLNEQQAREFVWNQPNTFKPETVRRDPRFREEYSQIICFIQQVQSN